MKFEITQENAAELLKLSKTASANTVETDIPADLLEIINADVDKSRSEVKVAAIDKAIAKTKSRRKTLADFPAVVKEEDNPDILIKGRWLERGGSAFLVSTAGTGKSIWMTQFALSMLHAVPFSGLVPWRPLKCWCIQSEDSDSRVAIDRDDITAGLERDCQYHNGAAVDWRASWGCVTFLDLTGYTGAAFLEQLRNELESAKDDGELPDVVIINPFMDFLGADITSNADTIAFLSGGVLAGKRTEGLRSMLKEYQIAALIAHHTAKPPTDAELASWIMSDMPEYKACGAGYITNWGRSFVTMMKMPGLEGVVMLTAGKNGGGLGWPLVDGARRLFLSWDTEASAGGSGRRHYWRKLTTEEELQPCYDAVANLTKGKKRVVGPSSTREDKPAKEEMSVARAAAYWGNEIAEHHTMVSMKELRDVIYGAISAQGRTRGDARLILAELKDRPSEYGLCLEKDKFGKEYFVREEA